MHCIISEEAVAHDPNVDYERVVTKLKHPHTGSYTTDVTDIL